MECAFSFLAWLVFGSQESTVFRANTHLVQLNVIVRDKDGPVANLDKNDFVVTDRGKPRTIGVFSVHQASARQEGAPALAENTFSNRPLSGPVAPASVTMILLDRLNTLIGSSVPGESTPVFNGDLALQNAKQHLLKFVDEMGPTDRIAIYSLGTQLRVLSDFTGDRNQLKTILQSYRATSVTTREVAEPLATNVCPPNDPNGCPINAGLNEDRQTLASLSNAVRAQTTMAALMAMAAHVAGVPGRKNLVWLTSDLAFPAGTVARALSRSDIAIYPVDARGLLPVAMARSGGSATSQPMGPQGAAAMGLSPGAAGQPTGVNIMEALAEETGGRASINTNDLTGAVREAIEDGAVTYTLGFYIDSNSLDDKFHELKVRVKRAGFHVRTQRGYFALKDAASVPASLLAVPTTSPLESSAIHVLARVERTADGLSISGSIDVRDLQLDQSGDSSKGGVEIYLVQQDAAGEYDRAAAPEHAPAALTRQEYEGYLKTGVFFRTVLKPKDGLKTLRIIVTDSAHATAGSLIVPVSEIK